MTASPNWPGRFSIAPAKVTAYLLDPHHADGGPKCRFLAGFGFTPKKPGDLFDALHRHRREENFVRFAPAYRATKLYCEGPLSAPGRSDGPLVRTIWQMDLGDPSRTARFITLKPLPRRPV